MTLIHPFGIEPGPVEMFLGERSRQKSDHGTQDKPSKSWYPRETCERKAGRKAMPIYGVDYGA